MLELRPTCEHCNRALPPASKDAMICSFECTFCRECVDTHLGNVCPNCGGNLCPRPIRPAQDRRNGNFLGNYPASTTPVYRPKALDDHAAFRSRMEAIAPEAR